MRGKVILFYPAIRRTAAQRASVSADSGRHAAGGGLRALW